MDFDSHSYREYREMDLVHMPGGPLVLRTMVGDNELSILELAACWVN